MPSYNIGDILVKEGGNKLAVIVEINHIKEFGKPVTIYKLMGPNGYVYSVDEHHLGMQYRRDKC